MSLHWIKSRGQDEGWGPVIKGATAGQDGFSFTADLVEDVMKPIDPDYPYGLVIRGYACGAELAVTSIWRIDDDEDLNYLSEIAEDLIKDCAIECKRVVARIVAIHG